MLVLPAQAPSALARPVPHLHFFPDSRVVHQAGACTTRPRPRRWCCNTSCGLYPPPQAIFGMWMVFGIIFGIPGEATLFEHFLWWCVHLLWCAIPHPGSYALLRKLCFKPSVCPCLLSTCVCLCGCIHDRCNLSLYPTFSPTQRVSYPLHGVVVVRGPERAVAADRTLTLCPVLATVLPWPDSEIVLLSAHLCGLARCSVDVVNSLRSFSSSWL